MRAVINLAAMAVRWKRAVNTVEIPDEKKSTVNPEPTSEIIEEKVSRKIPLRKRATSLLTNEQPKKPMFTSSQRLNDPSKTFSPSHWKKQKEKILKPLPEKSSKERSKYI
jgi:hypothetical protein